MYNSYGSYGSGSMYSGLGGYGTGLGSLNSAAQGQQPQNPEQRNLKTQYQGMINGLSSIVQLSYAGVTLVTFGMHITKVIKTTYGFLKSVAEKIGTSMLNLPLLKYIPILISKFRMESPNSKNANTLLNRIFLLMRVISAICIFALLYTKKSIKKDVEQQCQLIEQQYENRKQQENNEPEGLIFEQKESCL